jgi:fructose-1,6-bisphosphatase/inositol monophosphatase family enzyme
MARKVVWIVVFGSAVLSLCAIAYGEDAAYFSSKNRDRSNEPRASDDRVS